MNYWQDGRRAINPVLTATDVRETRYVMEVRDDHAQLLGTLYVTELRASELFNHGVSYSCRIAENPEVKL